MEALAFACSRPFIPTSSRDISALNSASASPMDLGVRPHGNVVSCCSASFSSQSYKVSEMSRRRISTGVKSVLNGEDSDVVPSSSNDPVDQQLGESVLTRTNSFQEQSPLGSLPSGFSPDLPFTYDLSSTPASTAGPRSSGETQVLVASPPNYMTSFFADKQQVDRSINAAIAVVSGAFAITKVLTVDHDYWHGWTIFEILRYAPLHNWSAYEEALKTNPVLAKMMISGIVYAIGDWIAQCYEGRPVLEINRVRMIRSGLVGFCLHGSLSHFYYHACEALFPFDDWWAVPVKVAFDQTAWSGLWNSIYFCMLGILRLESPVTIASELRATFLPMLTAGWKLWPFAHLITYGLIPVEQRLLWVDCVELVWVTILSMYSNEKSEARLHDGETENTSTAESYSRNAGKL